MDRLSLLPLEDDANSKDLPPETPIPETGEVSLPSEDAENS